MRKNKKMSVEELKVIMFDRVLNASKSEDSTQEEKGNAIITELIIFDKLLRGIEYAASGSSRNGARRRYGK